MISEISMSRANSIVISGDWMDLAMQLIFTPVIERLLTQSNCVIYAKNSFATT